MAKINNKTVVTYDNGTTYEYNFKGEMTVDDKTNIDNFDEVLFITIGTDVTSLGECLFDHDEDLTAVFMPAGLKTIRRQAFWFSGIRRADIPEGVETIEKWAFSNCEKMKALTLPDSLTSIGESSFADAFKLKKLIIPKGLTKIPDCAFDHCESLSSLTLHNDITEIGTAAFRCGQITALVLPDKLESLGQWAFIYNTHLAEVEYKGEKYTSLKVLTAALTANGVILGKDVFSDTALQK